MVEVNVTISTSFIVQNVNGRGQFLVSEQEMATKFADREVLVLATGDDCSSRSNSENRESIDGKTGYSTEGLEDVGAVWEKHSRSRTL